MSNAAAMLLVFLAFVGFISLKVFKLSARRVVNSLFVFVFWYGSANCFKAMAEGGHGVTTLIAGIVFGVLGAKLLEE